VVWVPTPPEVVEKMLDLAGVTANDYVMDLGSGDGRNIIAAARRGARGLGIEFNPDMVALSRRLAREAGVDPLARFEQGDMYEADISEATVMAIYLLPANMDALLPKFQGLAPGSRIVANTFGFSDWDPDRRGSTEGASCYDWCEVLLWIVPAQVAGAWRIGDARLALTQTHQILYGTLSEGGTAQPLSKARMRGLEIEFTAGDRTFTGRLAGDELQGTVTGPAGAAAWRATRTP
jgi:SAM-dependent methyltransferase